MELKTNLFIYNDAFDTSKPSWGGGGGGGEGITRFFFSLSPHFCKSYRFLDAALIVIPADGFC